MAVKSCYSRFDELEKYTVKGYIVDALPAQALLEHRGKFFFVRGGAGTADEVYACIKGADDKLAFKKATLT